jgi:hypothetical protein
MVVAARSFSRASYMPKFEPRAYKSLVDSGIDTDEALDASETAIDCDADATAAIPAGSRIRIDNEYMRVTGTGTTLTVVRDGNAATHDTNADIYLIRKSSCVLWLPGQDDARSARIRDRSGYKNHGTIYGATWERLPSGLWVNSFDGVDDSIVCPSLAATPGTSLTAMAWINSPGAISAYALVFHMIMGPTAKYAWLLIRTADNKFYTEVTLSNDTFFGGVQDAVLPLNTWQQVVMSFDDADKRIHVWRNGQQVAQSAQAALGLHQTWGVVRWGGNAGVYWHKGRMALNRTWNRALSATEINGIYQSERHLFGV